MEFWIGVYFPVKAQALVLAPHGVVRFNRIGAGSFRGASWVATISMLGRLCVCSVSSRKYSYGGRTMSSLGRSMKHFSNAACLRTCASSDGHNSRMDWLHYCPFKNRRTRSTNVRAQDEVRYCILFSILKEFTKMC